MRIRRRPDPQHLTRLAERETVRRLARESLDRERLARELWRPRPL
jgi:hypothetical protein